MKSVLCNSVQGGAKNPTASSRRVTMSSTQRAFRFTAQSEPDTPNPPRPEQDGGQLPTVLHTIGNAQVDQLLIHFDITIVILFE
jgi:hypothetical protein